MNKVLYILFFLSLFWVGCSDNDDTDGLVKLFDKPLLSDVTPADKKIKYFFEKYNTYCKYEFTKQEFEWDWENMIFSEYSLADREHVSEAIDSLEKWVFKVFPADFARKYGPLNVLMVDSLGYMQVKEDYDWDLYEETGELVLIYTTYFAFSNGGDLATNYMVIAPVSSRFATQNMQDLKKWWLSLFVEKMFSRLPYPSQFARVSAEGYAKNYSSSLDVTKKHALLRRTRNVLLPNTRVSVQQDFGDYVAFIVYATLAEKQKYYAKNANILVKEKLMREYFKENFNLELPGVK